jgi:hypothetical protein
MPKSTLIDLLNHRATILNSFEENNVSILRFNNDSKKNRLVLSFGIKGDEQRKDSLKVTFF